MKCIILLMIVFSVNLALGNKDVSAEQNLNQSNTPGQSLPESYQELKHRMVHLDNQHKPLSLQQLSKDTDFTMLYVAGGIAAATTTFILINGNSSEGYFNPANTGVLIGGGVSTVLIVTKFFIDQSRRW